MSETTTDDTSTSHNNLAIVTGIIFAVLGGVVCLIEGYDSAGILGAFIGAPVGAFVFGLAGYAASRIRSMFREIFFPVLALGMIVIVIFAVILGIAEVLGLLPAVDAA
ncbi:MAG: hypothetical protein AAFV45_13525 [Pseudomonadota bacterium]